MARTVTLASLRTSVQRRGQYENSADITPPMLNEFINEAVTEHNNILVQRWADYYLVRGTMSLVIGTDLYALPADFYKLRKVEIVDSSVPSGYRRLYPCDLDVSHQFTTVVRHHYRYRLEAGSLCIVPTPIAAESLRLFYIPTTPLLVNDADTFDGVNGYEELVIQLALKRCKDREDLSTDGVDREIARLTMLVRSDADGRDATMPMTYNPYGGDDGGTGNDGGYW